MISPALLEEVLVDLAEELAPRIAAQLAGLLPTPVEPWRLLDVDEVAAIFGRSRRWVHGAVKARGLPFVRLDGGALAFDPHDLRVWASERRVPAATTEVLADRWQPSRKGAAGAESRGGVGR